MSSVAELAEGFVSEYLERQPEYIDVAEYVDDNADEDPTDEMIAEVYEEVASLLGVVAQRFDDRNN